MRRLLLFTCIALSLSGFSQVSRDTVLSRCPVFITDTVSVNNFFIEARPATLKVYRVRGDLTIVIEQRDQFFSLFFHEKRLRNTTYDIEPGSKSRGEVEVAYSFKSGEQVAFINVSDGTIQSSYDKEKKLWKIKVNGIITNMSDRTLSYYRARAEFTLK
ncbi:MAG: hypothetical protein ACT4OJ_12755 [Bacteroidota bacterium]